MEKSKCKVGILDIFALMRNSQDDMPLDCQQRLWTVDAKDCKEFNRLVDILASLGKQWRMVQSGTETNVVGNIIVAFIGTQFEAECIQEESFFVSEEPMSNTIETSLDNELVKQKDNILAMLNSGQYDKARTVLAFVAPMWQAMDYGYKVTELTRRLREKGQCNNAN
jgi:hypothetical protein